MSPVTNDGASNRQASGENFRILATSAFMVAAQRPTRWPMRPGWLGRRRRAYRVPLRITRCGHQGKSRAARLAHRCSRSRRRYRPPPRHRSRKVDCVSSRRTHRRHPHTCRLRPAGGRRLPEKLPLVPDGGRWPAHAREAGLPKRAGNSHGGLWSARWRLDCSRLDRQQSKNV